MLTNAASSRRTARIEARVTPRQKRLIERAAARRGQSVTDFIIAAAELARARPVVPTINLSAAAVAQLAEALRQPKPFNAALTRALREFETEVASGEVRIRD